MKKYFLATTRVVVHRSLKLLPPLGCPSIDGHIGHFLASPSEVLVNSCFFKCETYGAQSSPARSPNLVYVFQEAIPLFMYSMHINAFESFSRFDTTCIK